MSSDHSLFPDSVFNGSWLLCSLIEHTFKIQHVRVTLDQLCICGLNTLNNHNMEKSGSSVVLLGDPDQPIAILCFRPPCGIQPVSGHDPATQKAFIKGSFLKCKLLYNYFSVGVQTRKVTHKLYRCLFLAFTEN